MKKYNYYYDKTPIKKSRFEESVPENWEQDVINGEYSYGYYRAIEVEDDED